MAESLVVSSVRKTSMVVTSVVSVPVSFHIGSGMCLCILRRLKAIFGCFVMIMSTTMLN